MYLKFEKNKIICRVSQIEAAELLQSGQVFDEAKFPSGHVFTYRVELSGLQKNVVDYQNSTLTFHITSETIKMLQDKPTKDGVIFLQDNATYAFEIDMRKERRKKVRKT